MTLGPRDRDYSVALKQTFMFQQRPLAGGAWTTLTNVLVNTREGFLHVNNPWRSLKPADAPPTARDLNAFRMLHVNVDALWRGGSEYRKQGPMTVPVLTIHNGFPNDPNVRVSLVNEALIDAMTKLKDQRFNIGVCIAEAEGVARLVEDAGKVLLAVRELVFKRDYRAAYERFRRAYPDVQSYPSWRREYWEEIRHVQSVRQAKFIPEGWLYYHYGIKPTINDIDGALSEFVLRYNLRENPNYYKGSVIGYSKVKSESRSTVAHDWLVSDLETKQIESVRVKLWVQPKENVTKTLSTLGVTNPAEAAWNRIPFSFVVDYFVSVGDWLHVLDTWVGWEFGDWEESYRRARLGGATVNPQLSQDGTLIHVNSTPGKYSAKMLDRVIHNTLYGPMASILPRIKLRNPSTTQMANLLSLLATSFKRTIRP